MSAKLLYSLSDNKSNQQKQNGCMNGFLQFFDPHHFISSPRASNLNRRILPPDDNKHQGGANCTSKKTKGKQLKTIKTREISSESSRISVSSSASTLMSPTDCERSVRKEPYGLSENLCTDKHLTVCRVNQPYSTCPSQIKTAKRESVVRHEKKHVESPRLLQPQKQDSPRLVIRSESFRSASSSQSAVSAPILPLRKNPNQAAKDTPRFPYDGRETRDLPRLSLDSRQRATREYVRESKDDLVLRHLRSETLSHRNGLNFTEQPASCRPPSNIVAKLMGLEALPDCSPSIKNEIEQDESSICGSTDFLSRSSQTIDERKVKGGLRFPKNNSRESKTPAARKNKVAAPTNPELSLAPHKHALTMYAKIEERMNDLDFKRSGKDLRALKQVLESINREKNKMCRKENWSSGCIFQDGISHAPLTNKEFRTSKDSKLRDTKPGKLVTDHKKEAAIHQTSIGKPGNGIKGAAKRKTTKNITLVAKHFHDPSHRTFTTTHNTVGKRTPRPKATSKGQPTTKNNIPSPVKNSKIVSSNIYSYIPDTKLGSNTKQHKSGTKGLLCQSEKVGRRSYILKGKDDISNVLNNYSTILSHEESKDEYFSKSMSEVVSKIHTVLTSTDQAGMKYNAWQQATNDQVKSVIYQNSAEVSGDSSLEELAVAVREQPSPVSVLDNNFYGDESPSPVKKKTTPFRDYETNAIDTLTEWRDIDLNFLPPNSLTPCFSYEKEDIVHNFRQIVLPPEQLDHSPGRNKDFVEFQEEVNLEKECVAESLATSEFLDYISCNVINLQVEQSQKAVNSKLFHLLEPTKGNKYLSENRSISRHETITGVNNRHQRKLLFDTVNEILTQKLSSTTLGIQPQLLQIILVPRTNGQELLQEILTEIDQLQASSFQQSLDDEDAFLTTIIQKDLGHTTGNWTDVSSEMPGLVLDIEKLIFKDLIAELIT